MYVSTAQIEIAILSILFCDRASESSLLPCAMKTTLYKNEIYYYYCY